MAVRIRYGTGMTVHDRRMFFSRFTVQARHHTVYDSSRSSRTVTLRRRARFAYGARPSYRASPSRHAYNDDSHVTRADRFTRVTTITSVRLSHHVPSTVHVYVTVRYGYGTFTVTITVTVTSLHIQRYKSLHVTDRGTDRTVHRQFTLHASLRQAVDTLHRTFTSSGFTSSPTVASSHHDDVTV